MRAKAGLLLFIAFECVWCVSKFPWSLFVGDLKNLFKLII